MGYTVLGLMMVLSVFALFASFTLPVYNEYVAKSRLVEVATFMGEVRQELISFKSASGVFPNQIKDSRSSLAVRLKKQPEVARADSRVSPGNAVISEYHYEHNPEQDWVFIAVRLNRELIPECSSRCTLHMALVEVGDHLETFCGRWSPAFWRDPFPPAVLPLDCRNENVSQELGRAIQRR